MKLALMVLGFLVVSCVDTNQALPKKSYHEIADKALIKQTYVATLKPINSLASENISGAVTVNIEGDFMVSNVRVTNAIGPTVHAQKIHIGHFCPNNLADDNQDGYIDIQEAKNFTEEILIPLDRDLNSQMSEFGIYPLSDDWGSYVYSEVNSYQSLLSDLYQNDDDPSDDILKLNPGMPVKLDERVVVIYGISDSTVLPETVGSAYGLTRNQTLPIACGVFSRIDQVPGSIEDGDVTIGILGQPRTPTSNPQASPMPTRTTSGQPQSPRSPLQNRANTGETSQQCQWGKECNQSP